MTGIVPAASGYVERVDHYSTLGVAPTATRDEIRRSYLSLARRYHPDRAENVDAAAAAAMSARMAAVNDAWRVLGDAAARAAYDRHRPVEPPLRPAPPASPPAGSEPGWFDADEPAPDTISGTPVQLVLRVMPWVVIALVVLGLFVFTAYAGPDEPAPRQVGLGSCVLAGDELSIVACDRVNDGRVVEILPAGRECSDPDARTLPRPGLAGTLCLETTLSTRTP